MSGILKLLHGVQQHHNNFFMKVIENALSKAVQEQLKDFVLSKLPWYYLNNITFKNSRSFAPAFGHVFVGDGKTYISTNKNVRFIWSSHKR